MSSDMKTVFSIVVFESSTRIVIRRNGHLVTIRKGVNKEKT